MSMYLVGVSHTFNNYKARRADPTRDRKRKMAFYVSESGHIHSEVIGFWEFYFKKYFVKKWRRRKAFCFICQNFFEALVKSNKDEVECPNCL